MNDPRFQSSGPVPSIRSSAVVAPKASAVEYDPIELVQDEAPVTPATSDLVFGPPKSKIRALGVGETSRPTKQWKRATHCSGQGACRVKSFHAKYSEGGIEHIDDLINDWLDAHADVEVKFVTSTVNVFEGKIREPALVLNLWY